MIKIIMENNSDENVNNIQYIENTIQSITKNNQKNIEKIIKQSEFIEKTLDACDIPPD